MEDKSLRQPNKCFYTDDTGKTKVKVYSGLHYYENKLGIGDGITGLREIDNTLLWDETKRGWYFQYNSFHPFIPEYADEWIDFRDLYQGKDQTISFKPVCKHILGRKFTEKDGVADYGWGGIIYDNAFGEGIDLVIVPHRTGLQKLVRIKEANKPKEDVSFDFEMKLSEMPVYRADIKEISYEVDITRTKEFDTNKYTLIGTDRQDGQEWFTYFKPLKYGTLPNINRSRKKKIARWSLWYQTKR